MKSVWQLIPELLSALRQCVADKMAPSDTARHLSGIAGQRISRNACLGKADREGLHFNSGASGSYPRKPKGPRIRKPVEWKPMPKLSTETEQPFGFLGLNIWELQANNCRYIEGEVPGDHSYCGQTTIEGSSWCRHHLRIVNHVHAGQGGSLQNGRGRAYRSHPGF